ncbi:leukocyte cell-derived chemotaxin-2 isoform X1 [Antechinus flavipes]|uniref:leukocyte cell-derived chemotaxin-2 isoform X1 n=1 Tax=Antechinus flavipes TaxID=38775 RepID=UPI0022367BF5|nr:leukocyte cell-derived chemotaxin-2 isoform X1 [Antechinus flavipes]
MFPIRVLILVALISVVLSGPWATICAGKNKNTIRDHDNFGSGKYGASRGARKHKGVDVECTDGSDVYAPFDGEIVRQAKPYKKNNAINDGVEIRGGANCIKIFYIHPKKYKGSIKKGEKLGILLPMQQVYRGIKSHVHIQNCDLSDPTSYL